MKCDIVCFSHLRWDFVYQRPQHLLSRFALNRRIFFIEEPVWDSGKVGVEEKEVDKNVCVITPFFSSTQTQEETIFLRKAIVDNLVKDKELNEWIAWYYDPQAICYTMHLQPLVVVYDCMDELSAFKNPPPQLRENEAVLVKKADVMFMGGYSLYNAKKHLNVNSYPFPSSIDREHFFAVRSKSSQGVYENMPRPRLGFYGVIDERFNTQLLEEMAGINNNWSFIIIGPLAKISENDLPKLPNIYYPGKKNYQELPLYLSGWDIAIMPFALNDATRFISPTKTPEFLAAGKPVISSSIADVVEPYGNKGLVSIADTAAEFTNAANNIFKTILSDGTAYSKWLGKVDSFLHGMSWDKTQGEMEKIIEDAIRKKLIRNDNKTGIYV